eukprot:GGOE01014290.1.p1 GENE.GGOE01014290.1~~GGOE01014290.1.p1  ORF type:complete len:614 (+),score=116.12 GGOE01014290.1:48-1844(+)
MEHAQQAADADGMLDLARGLADPTVETGYILPQATDTPPAMDHQRMLQPDGRPAEDGCIIRPTPENYIADNPTAPPFLRKRPLWAQMFERNSAFRAVGRCGPKWMDRQRSLVLGLAAALSFLLVGLMVVPLINGSTTSPDTLLAFYFSKGTANWELVIPSNWPVLFYMGIHGVTNETKKGALYYVDYATPTCEDVFESACGECRSAGTQVRVAMILSLVTVFPALLLDLHRIVQYFDLNLSKVLALILHLVVGLPLAVWPFVAFSAGCLGRLPIDVVDGDKGVGIHFEWENGTLYYTMLVLAFMRPLPGLLHLLVPTPVWAHPEVPLNKAKAHGLSSAEDEAEESEEEEEEEHQLPAHGPLQASSLPDQQDATPDPLSRGDRCSGDRIAPLGEAPRQPPGPYTQEATESMDSDSERYPPLDSSRFDYGAFISARGAPPAGEQSIAPKAMEAELAVPTQPATGVAPTSSRADLPLTLVREVSGDAVSNGNTGDFMSGSGTAPPSPRHFSVGADVFVDPFADGFTAEASAEPDNADAAAAPEEVDVELESNCSCKGSGPADGTGDSPDSVSTSPFHPMHPDASIPTIPAQLVSPRETSAP